MLKVIILLVCCGIFPLEIECMRVTSLPSPAIDPELGPEPEKLAHLHANLSRMGSWCFMPKSAQEMDAVLAKKDNLGLGNGIDLNEFWSRVGFSTRSEIEARLADADFKFVEKYVNHMKNFIALTDMEKYESIVGALFCNPLGEGFIRDIGNTVHCCHLNKIDKTTRQKLMLAYIVDRLHQSFTKYHSYERAGLSISLLSMYTGFVLNDYKALSPDNQKVYDFVKKTLLDGLVINI
jgi:hypothetical protein